MRSQAPQLVDEQLINGMHVHVAVPGRSAAVSVLNRIRPWLPVLVAMASNSPAVGRARHRLRQLADGDLRQVGGERAPAPFAGAADHDRRVRTLLDSGVITDTGQLYWQARLSERYPPWRCAAPTCS
ncbi:glutamate-cysteine ligase family protein [Streptomyces somaliensis]|uniref:glutamate-cysteine ligase family protein n=1 Tax=Streptomyces somaliensis TaxID=78355 RepID=UPI0034E97D4B